MPLPFTPEPLEKMREKFPNVFKKVWRVTHQMNDRPGLHREYLFDFESGLRLLISRTDFGDEIKNHLSASWEWNVPQSLEAMHKQVIDAYRSIGGKDILVFLGWSIKSIPHWVIEQES